jgi:hypothetical protein
MTHGARRSRQRCASADCATVAGHTGGPGRHRDGPTTRTRSHRMSPNPEMKACDLNEHLIQAVAYGVRCLTRTNIALSPGAHTVAFSL